MEQPSSKPGVLVTIPSTVVFPGLLQSLQERYTLFQLPANPSLPLPFSSSIVAIVGFRASSTLLDSLPNLRIIVSPAVGLDSIDLPACRSRGISVTHIPHASTHDVAEFAILLMLAVLRRICPLDRFVRQRLWPAHPDSQLTTKASGRKVGIVGLGRIGLAIAKRAEAFGCSISYHGSSSKPDLPYVYYSTVVDLAANSDVLFLSCPLTKETRHMIGRAVLDALGPEGTLVNIARGSIVEEIELIKALKEGRLGAAALDVFEDEPNVPVELFSMDNVVMTPHMASGTYETRSNKAKLLVANLDAYFSGRPLLNCVC